MSIRIDCEFPGGNIIVDRIEEHEVYLRQDLRDTEGPWFYWYFRVRDTGEQELTFYFTDGDVIGTQGPAVSTDGGWSWSWLGRSCVNESSFSYSFTADMPEVRFSFAMPYTEEHLHAFLGSYDANPHIKKETLCLSRKGREVEQLFLGKPDTNPQYKLIFTSRHHCCEMMADYAVQGIIEEILSGSETGEWFLENTEVCIVPFVDKDGVEDGDQGKKRRPRDHGRDYKGKNIYTETAAIQKFLPGWAEDTPLVALDIHCPWIRGDHNEDIYFVGGQNKENWKKVLEFSKVLESVCKESLPYNSENNLPFGELWNKPDNFTQGRGFKTWNETIPGVILSSAMEIPYATAGGEEVNASSAQAFGRDLAKAFAQYLSKRNR
ncbi:M14 family zinc carboxypeptidase [Planctomycetota bacterium]